MPIWFAEVSYDDWILYEKKKSVYPPGEVNWQVLGLAKRILIFSVTDVALRAWVVLLVSDLFNLQAQLVSDPLSSSELRCWAIL